MTPKRAKYIREERNGKVVYLPSPESAEINLHNPNPRQNRDRTRRSQAWMRQAIGWSFNAWFPPLAWLGASTVTVGLGWLAWQMLTNPDMTFWVNQFSPDRLSRTIPADDQPKTIPEILNQLKRHDKEPGQPMALVSGFRALMGVDRASAIAIPLKSQYKDTTCPQGCSSIDQLLIYRTLDLPPLIQWLQRNPRFRRVGQIQLGGPSTQDFNQLIRSVTRSGRGEGSSIPLKLSQIEQKTLNSDPDIWLILTGLQAQGNATASYGQILHFSQETSQISVILNWLSPSGKMPRWEDLSGNGKPEIVIDQSIGLEPSFAAYEIQRSPNGAVWTKGIDLKQPALNTSEYQGALKLANSGLWIQAQQQLTEMRAQREDLWSSSTEAQFQLIQRHSNTLQSSSTLAFSDPIEEIQTLLVQGFWTKAQEKLFGSRDTIPAIQRILAADNGQIGDRIQAAAQFGTDRKAAIEWGIIYAYAKGGKAQAEQWLKPIAPKSSGLIDPLIKKLTQSPKVLTTPAKNPPAASQDPATEPTSQKSETP